MQLMPGRLAVVTAETADPVRLTQVQKTRISPSEIPPQARDEFALADFALTHVRQPPVAQALCSCYRKAFAAPRSRTCRAGIGEYWLLALPVGQS
jgi:hypothetical protein